MKSKVADTILNVRSQKDILKYMQWDRSNTIGLAHETCKYCEGNGTRVVYKTKASPCNCVFRAIFRACLSRFRDCASSGTHFGTVSWEFCGGAGGRRVYSRKTEEYMADFCLVSRRMLDEEDHRLFRYYFLLGADWQLCARYFKMDRGNFFHAIYRVERTLGRAFSEIRPYPLYPLDEYFGGTIRKDGGRALEALPAHHRQRLQVPLRLSA